jgi:hypothetical protein
VRNAKAINTAEQKVQYWCLPVNPLISPASVWLPLFGTRE